MRERRSEREKGEKESKGERRRDGSRKEGEKKTEKARREKSRGRRNKEKEGILHPYKSTGSWEGHMATSQSEAGGGPGAVLCPSG